MKVLVYFFIMFFLNRVNEPYYEEVVNPVYNDKGRVIRIDYNIKLLANLDEYLIDTNLFESLREFKEFDKGEIKIKFSVNSKKKYQYVKNSFNIETDDFEKDRSNYKFLDIRGFDGKRINSIFVPYKENLNDKEDNLDKIQEAYNYFYLQVLDFSYDGNVYFNVDNYKDIKYKDGFKLIIRINENKYKDIYKDYNYYGKMSFKLKKAS